MAGAEIEHALTRLYQDLLVAWNGRDAGAIADLYAAGGSQVGYDGSVVNWVNGPLLAAVARRHGYDAHYQTFNRQGSNIITLTARIQE